MQLGATLINQGKGMTVLRRLGGGIEGEVFETCDQTGWSRLALKWYHDHQAPLPGFPEPGKC